MKYLLLISFFISFFTANAQLSKSTLFTKLDLVNEFHTTEDLEDYGKSDLVKLYIQRNSELQKVLPFIGLTTKPDQNLSKAGVKPNNENVKILAKHKTAFKKFQAENTKLISEFLAYADKQNLIWSVLYMEEVIKKLRLGFEGNF